MCANMDLAMAKVLALFILLIGSMIFGLLPIYLRKKLLTESPKSRAITSALLCFGAGVLLATSFIHILPESEEMFEQAVEKSGNEESKLKSLAGISFCLGFFLIYLVEELVHYLSHSKIHHAIDKNAGGVHRTVSGLHYEVEEDSKHKVKRVGARDELVGTTKSLMIKLRSPSRVDMKGTNFVSLPEAEGNPAVTSTESESSESPLAKKKEPGGNVGKPLISRRRWGKPNEFNVVSDIDDDKGKKQKKHRRKRDKVAAKKSLPSVASLEPSDVSDAGSPPATRIPSRISKLAKSAAAASKDRTKTTASNATVSTIDKVFSSPFFIRDFVTVLALSFHAIFEGLAIGLADEESEVFQLFGAVSAHKFVIAFSFGMELMQASPNIKLHVIYITTFALMSALGIAIGTVITTGQVEDVGYVIATGILQALSAGTLMYVAISEVLERERLKKVSGLLQLGACVFGFAVMTTVDLTTHSHSHGDGHGHGHDGHDDHDHDGHDDHDHDGHGGHEENENHGHSHG